MCLESIEIFEETCANGEGGLKGVLTRQASTPDNV